MTKLSRPKNSAKRIPLLFVRCRITKSPVLRKIPPPRRGHLLGGLDQLALNFSVARGFVDKMLGTKRGVGKLMIGRKLRPVFLGLVLLDCIRIWTRFVHAA